MRIYAIFYITLFFIVHCNVFLLPPSLLRNSRKHEWTQRAGLLGQRLSLQKSCETMFTLPCGKLLLGDRGKNLQITKIRNFNSFGSIINSSAARSFSGHWICFITLYRWFFKSFFKSWSIRNIEVFS